MSALKDILKEFDPQTALRDASSLTGLDISFAKFLQSHQATSDTRHLWLAALTSHQWGRGHACLDLVALETHGALLLGCSKQQLDALPANLRQAAHTLPWTQGDASPLVWVKDSQGERLYLRRAWHAEQTIQQQILQRISQPIKTPADLDNQLQTLFEADTSMQRTACEVAAKNNITLITGGPGTGKTTTVVKLLALLIASSPETLRIHLCAPTGKAAARLTESITKALPNIPSDVRSKIPTQTQTLHRLLHRHSSETRVRARALATDVVVVDEASMVDLELLAQLLEAIPVSARLILLGDKDQLASVEAGAVMSQLCHGPLLQKQTVTLVHSHRFNADSGIGQWARVVNVRHNDALAQLQVIEALWNATPDWLSDAQVISPEKDQPFPHGNSDSSEVTRSQIQSTQDKKLWDGLRYGWRHWLSLLEKHLPSSSTPISTLISSCTDAQALDLLQAFSQFCVLCAVREGVYGVTQLNLQIEKALGFTSTAWYVGRPVMVTRNDYALELMNGDIGICLPNSNGKLSVAFPDTTGGIRWIATSRLDKVETVFAMTVHKSQGSEFQHVLLVIPAQDSAVLSRELIYTGLTRARDKLTIWAPKSEVFIQACGRRVLRSGGLGAG
jgi:exodeoxyribonuclease V alpha subunit